MERKTKLDHVNSEYILKDAQRRTSMMIGAAPVAKNVMSAPSLEKIDENL